MPKRLAWHNNNSHVARELYDPAGGGGGILGGVLRNDIRGGWDMRRRTGTKDAQGVFDYETFDFVPELEEYPPHKDAMYIAKRKMEDYIRGLPGYEEAIIVDEDKVTGKIYKEALHCIIHRLAVEGLSGVEAAAIARAVLNDPAGWREENETAAGEELEEET